jgi:transglutaminase-like putative cysteine protease
LSENDYFDYRHPLWQSWIEPFRSMSSEQARVKAVYLAVRDGWRYNPYKLSFQKDQYRASYILQKEDAHCVDKSILLITALRALNIPARLHLAKVANHIAVDRLVEKFGKNEIAPHGMVDVYVAGSWKKASPAFNKELCDRFQVAPLDFDGTEDSIFQEYTKGGAAFMQYLEDYGHFDEVPMDFMMEIIKDNYPSLYPKIASREVYIV